MSKNSIWEVLKNTPATPNESSPKKKKNISLKNEMFKNAILRGNLSDVQEAIENGMAVNQSWGKTNPLYLAMKSKNESMVTLLFKSGARLDVSNPVHHSLWKSVGVSNNVTMAQILLDCHMSPGKADEWWDVDTWIKKSPEFFRFWLDKKQNVDLGMSEFEKNHPGIEFFCSKDIGTCWLYFLINHGKKEEAQSVQSQIIQDKLLGPEWEKAQILFWKKLIVDDNVEGLIEFLKADFIPPSSYSDMVYDVNAPKGSEKYIYKNISPENYLRTALVNGSYKAFAWLAHSPDLVSEFIEDWYIKPYPRFLGFKKFSFVQDLVQKGLSIEKTDGEGMTILHYACDSSRVGDACKNEKNWFKMCHSLLEVENNKGQNPLDIYGIPRKYQEAKIAEIQKEVLDDNLNASQNPLKKSLRL